MTQSPETGHAKNVANFENLISICTGYGTSYNPSKAAIKLTALSTLFTDAKNALSAINTAFLIIPEYIEPPFQRKLNQMLK